MKKTVKNIIIMLVVLVVLGGAATALLLLQKSDAENTPVSSAPVSSQTETTSLISMELTDIKSIDVKNGEGEFTIIPGQVEGDRKLVSTDFVVDGYQDYNLNTTVISACVECVRNMNASKDLGKRDDLAEFGLAGEGSSYVTLTDASGKKTELVLGSEGGESAGRYVLKDGAVYIVGNVSKYYFSPVFDFFGTFLYSIDDRTEVTKDENGNMVNSEAEDLVTRFVISGAHFPEEIEIVYNEKSMSNYLMVSPITAESGNEKFSEIVNGLQELSADRVAAVKVTDEQLKEFGLDEPYAKIDFEINDGAHVLAVSEEQAGGTRYLQCDGKDVVYVVKNSAVAPWCEVSLLSIRMSYIWLANIMEVKDYKVTADGKEYEFKVTRTVNEEKTDANSTVYDLTVETAAGDPVDYTVYQPFYRDMLSIAVLSTEKAEYSGTPKLKIEYGYFENGAPDTVEFYPVGEDRYAAVLNGGFNGLVRRSEVDKVLSRLESVYRNEG